MSIYATSSGIAVTDVRVSNFRSLANIEVVLGDLTVLIGANNAGKTSFLDAMFAAIGAGRKNLGANDIRVEPGESFAPKDRTVVVDVRVFPIGPDGKCALAFPPGSFWTTLWGSSFIIDMDEKMDLIEFIAFRTTLAWSDAKGDYVVERKPLKEWRSFDTWRETPLNEKTITAAQLEPIALHYIDAKRDLDDDLRKAGSFWRRMTDDLGLEHADIEEIEATLSQINQQIVEKSEVLKHLKTGLSDLQNVVSADSAGIDIAPVARQLRDLSKGIDVSFSTCGAQSFPLSRHGMGTRSLASLLVFRAFASWRDKKVKESGDMVHSVLALEEPESHLHPQAQRSLFGHIKAITGQRVVSTHSPYFAGQAALSDLRLFIKQGGDTTVASLDLKQLTNPDHLRQLQETVIESRGDLLFATAVILFEGQTEEQALPIWAKAYWGASIHELGFSFVRVNGDNYFPFIWLAKSMGIPWFIMADGEPIPVTRLEAALKKAGCETAAKCSNVEIVPNGENFESHLIANGYMQEIEVALNVMSGKENFLDQYIEIHHGKAQSKGNGGGFKDYKSAGGRERATKDAMDGAKTKLSKPLATTISSLKDPARQFPPNIRALFEVIAAKQGIAKLEAPLAPEDI
ncbi:ATP-dependent endonuclease [Janthinobacterium sp. AD80]|uniref:ATP-dependent nuclease n=1 Tax=Janthinobacterium sp. AD80 TaxID=1528773 RepID=UPI000C83B44A|nr:AAA family ATPase [Janthinobacterium sp. AD80]PMQ16346.1 DNA replication and repair protein RecF [Janthinobacterium sp. AD80]